MSYIEGGGSRHTEPLVSAGGDDELSEISDGEGYLYPEDDPRKTDMTSMRVAPCRIKSIRGLYTNTDKVKQVYPTSHPLLLLATLSHS